MTEYLCECRDPRCRKTIPLETEEITFLHRQRGLVMFPGHQIAEDEIIGEDSEGRFVYVAERR